MKHIKISYGGIYQTAKKELYNAGIRDLNKTVGAAIQICKALDEEVKQGKITLKEARDTAKDYINGPLDPSNNKRDNSKAHFTYKSQGYTWAQTDDCVQVMHPLGYEGVDLKDFKTPDGKFLLPNTKKSCKKTFKRQ